MGILGGKTGVLGGKMGVFRGGNWEVGGVVRG